LLNKRCGDRLRDLREVATKFYMLNFF
jgi:hypothetical protein